MDSTRDSTNGASPVSYEVSDVGKIENDLCHDSNAVIFILDTITGEEASPSTARDRVNWLKGER